jgi:TolA-binding protein
MTKQARFLVLFGVLLAAPTPALAQKFAKKTLDMQGVVVPPHASAAAGPRAAATAPAPRLTLEEFTNLKQGNLQKLIDQQITQLRQLIALASPDDPKLPDYWFRLGELYAEKYRYFEHRARSLDEKIFRAEHGDDPGAAAPPRREQEDAQTKAEQSRARAMSNFVTAAKYPRYERMDEVLYRLGALLRASGREDQARLVFHRLLKEYPQSRYVPDALLAFADDYFAKGDMGQALAFYDKVAQFPRAAVFGFALYKKAWSQANLGAYGDALATFVELLGHCQTGAVGPAQRGPLAREARRDLVRVYARVPGANPDRALVLFARVAGDDAKAMLLSLAEVYWEEGMAGHSSRVYRKVMALEPRSPLVCAWQDKVLRNTLSVGSEAEQVQELERLGASYHYVGQLAGVKADVRAECRGRFHDAASELAFLLHKQAVRTKQAPTFALAAAAYRAFLTDFDSEPASGDVAFYYAECLWQLAEKSSDNGLWRAAAEQYTRVVHRDDHGPHVKDAAYAAVLAWQNALYEDTDDLRREPARSTIRVGAQSL